MVQWACYSAAVFLSVGLLAGCQSNQTGSTSDSKPTAGASPAPAVVKAPEAAPSSPAAPSQAKSEQAAPSSPAAPSQAKSEQAAPAAPAAPALAKTDEAPAAKQVVRIKAGLGTSYKDSAGNVWLPDQGFDGGETIEREGELSIANTADPAMYRTEHFSMTAFTYPLPNGKYTVKLYFAETFEGIEAPGQRVFSFSVQGHEFKDFDVWVKANGPRKAYIETVPVEITGGKLEITFKAQVENPEVNAIEIIPET
jgi:hypothetical protein